MREEELVEHCKQKDKSAQKRLYELYAGALFALCIRYSGNRETARIFCCGFPSDIYVFRQVRL